MPPQPSTNKNRIRSLMVFNHHRRMKASHLPDKSSVPSEGLAIAAAILIAAIIAILLYTHLSHHS